MKLDTLAEQDVSWKEVKEGLRTWTNDVSLDVKDIAFLVGSEDHAYIQWSDTEDK